MIDWLHPLALLLLPLPWLLERVLPAERLRTSLAVPERVARLLGSIGARRDTERRNRRWRQLLVWIGWIGLVLALAAPVTRGGALNRATGRDLLLALDMSASMLAKDVSLDGELVERFAAVKALAHAFIRRRSGDRVGLIVFGNNAYLIAPLTYDVDAVATFLDEITVGLPGRRTAVGDAIGLGIKTLMHQPSDARVMIVLSDGDSNAGLIEPGTAAALAKAHEVRIHTIGFGQADPTDTQTDGEPVDALSPLAEQTGGRHFVAESTAALRAVYQELDQLEPVEQETQQRRSETAWTREMLLITLISLLSLTWIDRRVGAL